MKEKYNPLKDTKDTIKVGVLSIAGHGIMGGMAGLPGMPAQASGTAGIIGAGLTLANVGQLTKNVKNMTKLFK